MRREDAAKSHATRKECNCEPIATPLIWIYLDAVGPRRAHPGFHIFRYGESLKHPGRFGHDSGRSQNVAMYRCWFWRLSDDAQQTFGHDDFPPLDRRQTPFQRLRNLARCDGLRQQRTGNPMTRAMNSSRPPCSDRLVVKFDGEVRFFAFPTSGDSILRMSVAKAGRGVNGRHSARAEQQCRLRLRPDLPETAALSGKHRDNGVTNQ